MGLNESTDQLLLQNSLALPGLFQNHNLILDLDAQIENGTDTYRFSDLFVYARGFQEIRFSELYRLGANYHFPILYPDKGAWGIFYLLRIRGSLFTDYSHASVAQRDFSSVGAELIFDVKWLNLTTIPIGVRYTQLLSQKAFSRSGEENLIELFLPVSRF